MEWAPCSPEAWSVRSNIFELDGHRFTRVQLQGQNAGDEPFGFGVVEHIDGLHAVDEMSEMVALGDDDVIVPIVLLDRRLNVGRLAELAGYFLFAGGGPSHFLPALGHNAASTCATRFVVKNSGKGRARFEVCLVAGRDEVRAFLAAILNARVGEAGGVVRRDAIRKAQLEIIDDQILAAFFRDQKVVAASRILFRRLANDGAIDDRPMFWSGIGAFTLL